MLPMRRKITYELSVPEQIVARLEKLGKCSLDIILPENNKQARNHFKTSIYRLKHRNLVVGERRGKNVVFMLTEEGSRVAKRLQLKLQMAKKGKWDGKWRIMIFDIPEKLRGKRDLLRKELISFGFMQLQKSVWTYPYPLPTEFKELWNETGISHHYLIIEASKIESDKSLRDFFFPKQK